MRKSRKRKFKLIKLVKQKRLEYNLRKFQHHTRATKSPIFFKSLYLFYKKKSMIFYKISNPKSVGLNLKLIFTSKNSMLSMPESNTLLT